MTPSSRSMKPAEAFAARRAVMADIEKESLDKTGLRSDVVTLYQGGHYHLYRYKKYTDVRLVLAPEAGHRLLRRRHRQLRVSALQPRHLLLPRLRGRQAGQGRALLQVEYQRPERRRPGVCHRPSRHDQSAGDPGQAAASPRRDAALHAGPAADAGGAAAAVCRMRPGTGADGSANDLHRVANARKAFAGQYQGLLDPAMLRPQGGEEKALRDQASSESASGKTADPWQRIEDAEKKLADFETLLSADRARRRLLFRVVRHRSPPRPAAGRTEPSPTPTGCASIAIPILSRSSFSSTRRPPFMPNWRRPSWPGRCRFWRRTLAATIRWW